VSIARPAAETAFDGRIVWGSGSQVGTRLAALTAAGEKREGAQLWYFGDVEAGGFRVARSAQLRADEYRLGILMPATGLYRLALERGRRRAVEKDARPASPRTLAWAREWLPATLGDACAEIAETGLRIVQESVGREVLAVGGPLADLL